MTDTRNVLEFTQARRIRAAMEEASMNETQLAAALGVNRKTVYNWLKSRHPLKQRDVFAIAQATGVDPSELRPTPSAKPPTDATTATLTAGYLDRHLAAVPNVGRMTHAPPVGHNSSRNVQAA